MTVVLPNGWTALPHAVLPRGDPLTRIVVASAPIRFGTKGCRVAAYAFPASAVALVVVEWVRATPQARLASRPRRFTSAILPVRPPPAIECWDGPGGSVQFADQGRRFAAFVLLGRHASPGLADRARRVLDTLSVRKPGS